MRLHSPFVQLPLSFDQQRLADEIGQFEENEWRDHPQGLEGNSSLILVSSRGEENDDLSGSMQAAARLQETPYIRQVMDSFKSVIGRSRLMRIEAGASVVKHTDRDYYWRDRLRIHIPIVTEPSVVFNCGPQQVHMAGGESWTFNNLLPHSVENRSDVSRIHLVIDTVGSSALWKMINAQDNVSRQVKFDPDHEPNLRFETFQGLAVMPPAELRFDLIELIEDIDANNSDTRNIKHHLRLLAKEFLHDWKSEWMVYGPSIDGFANYKNILKIFRRDISKLSNGVALKSDKVSFKKAVGFTLDACLAEDRLTQPATANDGLSEKYRLKFDRPIFIVAAPRSGSTLLFETLAFNKELWSLGDESHKHFESIATLRPNKSNSSNRLTAELVTIDVKEALLNSFIEDLVNCDGKKYSELTSFAQPNDVRFLEKTPKNALRIPFILKLFPEARFIFLYRDARQNMSSLLETWRSQKWVTYPKLPNWPLPQDWSHLLIPGWEKLGQSSLAEIVAQQWMVTNQTILDDLSELPRERWCTVDYDSLVSNTVDELQRLCFFSQVAFGPRMLQIASRPLKHSKYTLTAPQADKWHKNAEELSTVIPATEPLMARLRTLNHES